MGAVGVISKGGSHLEMLSELKLYFASRLCSRGISLGASMGKKNKASASKPIGGSTPLKALGAWVLGPKSTTSDKQSLTTRTLEKKYSIANGLNKKVLIPLDLLDEDKIVFTSADTDNDESDTTSGGLIKGVSPRSEPSSTPMRIVVSLPEEEMPTPGDSSAEEVSLFISDISYSIWTEIHILFVVPLRLRP